MNDVQKKILEIFKVVKKLCDEHNIPYYAIGGTCLGTIRHKGFIPWDDDMDIAIPIEYRETFYELCKKKLPDHLALYTSEEIPHFTYIFDKIMDINTTFIEEVQFDYPDSYKGIFLDIMWLSGLPENPVLQKIFQAKVFLYNALNVVHRLKLKDMRTWKHKLFWMITLVFRINRPYYYFSERYMELLMRYPVNTSEYVGYTWLGNVYKYTYPANYFSHAMKLPFEDTIMKCPFLWNKVLTQHFGDYMQLPPENERVGKHGGIVKTDRSYRDYQAEKVEEMATDLIGQMKG